MFRIVPTGPEVEYMNLFWIVFMGSCYLVWKLLIKEVIKWVS